MKKKDHPLIRLLINYLKVSENIDNIKRGQEEQSIFKAPNDAIYNRWVASEIYSRP